MHLTTERFTGNRVKIEPGARDRHHSNLEKLTFTFWAVCDTVDPDSWHGEVKFGTATLLITEPAPNDEAAVRLAEKALEGKVAAVFGES